MDLARSFGGWVHVTRPLRRRCIVRRASLKTRGSACAPEHESRTSRGKPLLAVRRNSLPICSYRRSTLWCTSANAATRTKAALRQTRQAAPAQRRPASEPSSFQAAARTRDIIDNRNRRISDLACRCRVREDKIKAPRAPIGPVTQETSIRDLPQRLRRS
jgi:hypothetical protein